MTLLWRAERWLHTREWLIRRRAQRVATLRPDAWAESAEHGPDEAVAGAHGGEDPGPEPAALVAQIWLEPSDPAGVQPDLFDARARVAERRAEWEAAFTLRPPDWIGTASHWALYEQPYNGLWGYPERFERAQRQPQGAEVIQGLAGAPGVAEGTARRVVSEEEFDQVQPGDVLVCRMTNPAWVVLFTNVVAVVTDDGGVLSHPAVVAREFGIPAVVGTDDATWRIRSGDRVRVNGTTGVVEILSRGAGGDA